MGANILMQMNYDELDPGIRETVRWLRQHGFNTTDSGDGVSKPADERVFSEPHVVVICSGKDLITETDRLNALIAEKQLSMPNLWLDRDSFTIEGSYSPVDKLGAILLIRRPYDHGIDHLSYPRSEEQDDGN
jgi:hypothetical protein